MSDPKHAKPTPPGSKPTPLRPDRPINPGKHEGKDKDQGRGGGGTTGGKTGGKGK